MASNYLLLAAALFASPAFASPDFAADVQADYEAHLKPLFLDLHRNPELSFMENRTARVIARELRAAGATVTEQVGGTGVVGVMRNGEGPTILYRAEMDALPVLEESRLPYASTATQKQADGTVVPVAHACGHDVNMAAMIGTARRLSAMKDRWRGTVLFIGQPAEERSGGARAMVEDGLYSRFAKPDYALTVHVDAAHEIGTLSADPGVVGSSADTVQIIVHGVSAHGAEPQEGKDAIVMSAEIVMALQTLVSREIAPLNAGVVTVGSLHAGLDQNTVADRAEMSVTVRADDEVTRRHLIEGIKRIALNVARMNDVAESRLPEIKIVEPTPVTINDPVLTARMRSVLATAFGSHRVIDVPRTGMGADDFAYYVEPKYGVPGLYILVGGTPATTFAAANAGGPRVPQHHAPDFKIDAEAAIRLATEAMTVEILDLLAPASSTTSR